MEVFSLKYILKKYLIFGMVIGIVVAQINEKRTSYNPCTSKRTCRECIQTPSCAWCYVLGYKGKAGCFQPSSTTEFCEEEYILNPDNMLTIIQAEEPGKPRHNIESESISGTNGEHKLYFTPQKLRLKLRPKQPITIHVNYTKDIPIDVYYLMDLSRSMLDHKEELFRQVDQLASALRNITSDFRLGFGSFIDKVVMPFVSTIPRSLIHPCNNCVAPYGYKHAMGLSRNVTQFAYTVKTAMVSGNLDQPEGGLDALLQSIVCREQIGWRSSAVSFIVLATDASFHVAGDGKFGGIVKPNDGECHMDLDGLYNASSHQDYPSIEQINVNVKRHGINVIFAASKDTVNLYKDIAKKIEGASVTPLEMDSSNVVDLIREQTPYTAIKLKHNATDEVSIKFYTNYRNHSNKLVNTNKCDNIKVGDIVTFKIHIEVIKCPKIRKDHFQAIKIFPIGINESLTIDLEMACSCDCEKTGDEYYEENSPICSHQGNYKCGICECNPNAFGRLCQCTSEQLTGNTTHMDCVNPKGPSGLECSGKGQCVCGLCVCDLRSNPNENIYGDYCECDNFSCERHDGKLCSGPDHGTCDCGTCLCKEEWSGPNCAYEKSCYPPGVDDGKICSGNGICEYGKCICKVTSEGRFSGKFCEICPYVQENSPVCSYQGTFKCGTCECNPNAFGHFCQCFSEHLQGNTTQMDCINPKDPSGLECSGKGSCVCGLCACEMRFDPNENIYGKYCECDNFSCERHNGQLCSGPDHGICDCGTCRCKEEWSGPNCACKKSNASSCYPPGVDGSTICSGNGICECGECVCNVTSKGRFSGKFCETLCLYEENSPVCSYQGTYKCGICECNPNTFGRFCECISEQLEGNITQMDCVNPEGPSGLECFGRGQCICGRCACEMRTNRNEKIYGNYCECDNFSCERHNGKLCSGPDHGICDCGNCLCKEEWTGSNCACKKSIAACYPPGVDDGKICSGNGICECGECVCNVTSEGRFSGKFCETCNDYEENSPNCSYQGTYKCGICECNPNTFGRFCECISEQLEGNSTQMDCVHPKGGLECFGRGQCICGRCACEMRTNYNEKIYGNYCECDNFSCDRHNGQLCSGQDHGICDCGKCLCEEEWTGSNCGCKKSNAACYPPGVDEGKICSGNGVCECGVCICNVTSEGRFSGKFCEKCPTCTDRCDEFKDCVQCQQYRTGPLETAECRAKCEFVPISVEEVKADDENGEVICIYKDEEDCRFAYVYYYDENNNLQIKVQRERTCIVV